MCIIILSRSHGAETPENSIHLMLFCQDIVLSFIIFQVHHLNSRRSKQSDVLNSRMKPPTPTLPGMGYQDVRRRSWLITVSPLTIGFGVGGPLPNGRYVWLVNLGVTIRSPLTSSWDESPRQWRILKQTQINNTSIARHPKKFKSIQLTNSHPPPHLMTSYVQPLFFT